MSVTERPLTKVHNGVTTTYTNDDTDQMTAAGGVTYGYDNNGNQTSRGADTFSYNAENRVTATNLTGTTGSYVYNGDGLRTSRTIGATTTTFAWGNATGMPVILRDSAGNRYLYGLDLISISNSANTKFYYHTDGLGSTTAMTDSTGTAAFLERALVTFQEKGVHVERTLTDNGGNYRSRAFAAVAAAHGIQLKRTRPYRPQTNGKAEAFNKTLQREWAYVRMYHTNAARIAALIPFLEEYNTDRPHTALGGLPPLTRICQTRVSAWVPEPAGQGVSVTFFGGRASSVATASIARRKRHKPSP